jgi:hypothetical protein
MRGWTKGQMDGVSPVETDLRLVGVLAFELAGRRCVSSSELDNWNLGLWQVSYIDQ